MLLGLPIPDSAQAMAGLFIFTTCAIRLLIRERRHCDYRHHYRSLPYAILRSLFHTYITDVLIPVFSTHRYRCDTITYCLPVYLLHFVMSIS